MTMTRNGIGSSILAATLLAAAACSGTTPSPPPGAQVRIDHLIVGIEDLDEGVRRLEELTGVRPVYGGVHPGGGTHNALLSLGDRLYLEIIALQGDDADTEWVTALAGLTEPTPIGWAVSTTDAPDTVERLEHHGFSVSPPEAGSRIKPDGAVLEWQVFFIEQPEIEGVPFFIQWSPDSVHPAETSPGGCRLRVLELTVPDATAVRDLVEWLDLGAEIEIGPDPSVGFGIVLDCPTGEVLLGKGE